MRYMILGALALACAAAASPSARAWVPEPCDKPIAQLNLEQIEYCQNIQKILRGSEEAFHRMKAEERHQEYLREHGCSAVTVRRRGEEPEVVERCK